LTDTIGDGNVSGFLEKTVGEDVLVDVKGESGGELGVAPAPFVFVDGWGVWLVTFLGERWIFTPGFAGDRNVLGGERVVFMLTAGERGFVVLVCGRTSESSSSKS